MADIAQIGFEVETEDLKRANDQLDEFASKESKIESSAQGISKSTSRAADSFKRLAATAGRAGSALGRGAFQVGATGAKASIIGLTGVVTGSLAQFARFEEELINFQKTANASKAEANALGDSINDMASEIPVASTELAKISVKAGQLGIRGVENIEKFTKTVGRLTIATDLAGEEAATSLARIIGVTNSSIENIDKLSASLVQLGNTSKATESEILRVANEVARATGAFNVTADETFALGAALRSMGQRAEIAGSAVGRTLREIQNVVSEGGSALGDLERVIGSNRSEIQSMIEAAPIDLLLQFTEGLDKTTNSSRALNQQLAEFGIKGEELLKVIPTLVQNSDMLSEKLNSSKAAFEENIALITESERAAESLSSEFVLLFNEIKETGKQIGEALAPAVQDASERFRGFLDDLQEDNTIQDFTKDAANAFIEFLKGADNAFNQVQLILAETQKSFLEVVAVLERLGVISEESGNKIEKGAEKAKKAAEKQKEAVKSNLEEQGFGPGTSFFANLFGGNESEEAGKKAGSAFSKGFEAAFSAAPALPFGSDVLADQFLEIGEASESTQSKLDALNDRIKTLKNQTVDGSSFDKALENIRESIRKIGEETEKTSKKTADANIGQLGDFTPLIEQVGTIERLTRTNLPDFTPLIEQVGTLDRLLDVELKSTFERSFDAFKEDVTDVSDEMRSAFDSAFQGIQDSLSDFIRTGELNFDSFVQSIKTSLSDIAAQNILGSLTGEGTDLIGTLQGSLDVSKGIAQKIQGAGAGAIGANIASSFVEGTQEKSDKIGSSIAGALAGGITGNPAVGAGVGAGVSAILGGEKAVGKRIEASFTKLGDATAKQITEIADTGVFSSGTETKIREASDEVANSLEALFKRANESVKNLTFQVAGEQRGLGATDVTVQQGQDPSRAIAEKEIGAVLSNLDDLPRKFKDALRQLKDFAEPEIQGDGIQSALSRITDKIKESLTVRFSSVDVTDEIRERFGEGVNQKEAQSVIGTIKRLMSDTLFQLNDSLGQTGKEIQKLSNRFLEAKKNAPILSVSVEKLERDFLEASQNIIKNSDASRSQLQNFINVIDQSSARFQNSGEIIEQVNNKIQQINQQAIQDSQRLIQNAIQGREGVSELLRNQGLESETRSLRSAELGDAQARSELKEATKELREEFKDEEITRKQLIQGTKDLVGAFEEGRSAAEELAQEERRIRQEREQSIESARDQVKQFLQGGDVLSQNKRADLRVRLKSQIDLLQSGKVEVDAFNKSIQSLVEEFKEERQTVKERRKINERINQEILEVEGKTLEARLNEFDKNAQQRIEKAKDVGANVAKLEELLGKKRSDIIERFNERQAEQERQAAQRRQNLNADFNKRLLEAQGKTLEARLAQFDRQAEKEIQQAREAGANVTLLEKVLAKEREQIVKDANERIAKKERQAAKERERFNSEVQQRLLEAQGKSLKARLTQFDRQSEKQIQEAKELGANVSLLEKTLAKERQQIIEEANQKQLEQERRQAEKRKQINNDLQTELLRLQGEERKARLREFEQSSQERLEEARKAGADIQLLEKVLAEKRSNIIEEFNEKALKETRDAAREQAEAAREFFDIAKSLGQTRQNLLTDQQSPLSPGRQFQEISQRFDETLQRALGGNQQAFGQLESQAQTLLERGRERFAAGPQFADLFQRVQESLSRAQEAALDEANSITEQQLKTLKQSDSKLADIRGELQALNEKIERNTRQLSRNREVGGRS